MVTTPLARAGILKSLKKAKIVKISRKLFFHSEVGYPKLKIPRKTKNSVFEQIQVYPRLKQEYDMWCSMPTSLFLS